MHRRLALLAAAALAAVAAVLGPTSGARSDPAGSEPTAVTVVAIRVAPTGQDGASGGTASAPPPTSAPGGGFAYPEDGSIARAGSIAATATTLPGVDASATGSADVAALSLFNGEITADAVAARASASGGVSGGSVSFDGAAVTNLVALGQPVSTAPGTRVQLGDWGSLSVLLQDAPPAAGSPPRWEATLTTIDVHLDADHGGLPAGSEIVVGYAAAAAQSVPPPTTTAATSTAPTTTAPTTTVTTTEAVATTAAKTVATTAATTVAATAATTVAATAATTAAAPAATTVATPAATTAAAPAATTVATPAATTAAAPRTAPRPATTAPRTTVAATATQPARTRPAPATTAVQEPPVPKVGLPKLPETPIFTPQPAEPQSAARAARGRGPLQLPPADVSPKLTAGGYVFPVYGDSGYGDTFGAPRADVTWHHGDDIFAPLGAPVLSVADGTVFSVGWNKVGGNRLWLRDGEGNEFYYAHLSAFSPLSVDGARVKAGAVLGFVGNTGDAEGTPTHLHFEIHPVSLLFLGYDGVVDPTPFLDAWRHLEDLRFSSVAGWAPPSATRSTAPKPGAILLQSSDISSADGLDPGSLQRVLEAPLGEGQSAQGQPAGPALAAATTTLRR